ncbi:hypothetical protein [Nostoc sp. UIC 10630]|uniref:hypothetical protein n=1 Tax=Nostoc sp. UIC 10630 TaxID=2100146 RepID=UPI0013D4C439|nr:hypothetical protein [Nostoc sp. UIC 10630]NEU78087.1 hypothetical protein [Nostoc sp. UIC 10630]
MFISSQLQTDGVHLRALYQYVERFYSTHAYNWRSTGHQLRKVLPHPSYNLTSLLSRCGDISIETATQRHWMPNCQNYSGYSPIL